MQQLGLINPRGVTDSVVTTYNLREAVRAVVFDAEQHIALLHVRRDNYYKLPGGGVEAGETFERALHRECLEEIGSTITIRQAIGYTVEYWQEDHEKQISYGYIAHVRDSNGLPQLTASEQDRDFVTLWVPLPEAITLLETCIPTHWEGDYIPPREQLFLEAVQRILNNEQ